MCPMGRGGTRIRGRGIVRWRVLPVGARTQYRGETNNERVATDQ